MANIIVLTLDDPVDASLSSINSNFTALNTELGNHQHSASAINSGVLATARLGSGTASASTFLRGDQQWASIAPSDITAGGASSGNLMRWSGSAWEPSAGLMVDASGRIGIGTAAAHPLHGNASADWQGFRLDRAGSARALIAQDSAGGVIQLFDSSQNMRLQLHSGWYSKIPTRLGINLPDEVWPDYHLHVYDQSASATGVWVENNYGAAGAVAQVRCLSWSGTGTPVGSYFVGHGSRGTKASPVAVQTGDRLLALIGTGQQQTTQGTGAMVSIEAASNWSDSNRHSLIRFLANGPNQAGFPPAERMRIEGEGAMVLQPAMQTPSNPAVSSEGKIYITNGKLVIQYNDAGTVRYKYLDLTGTGVTWQHSTTAP